MSLEARQSEQGDGRMRACFRKMIRHPGLRLDTCETEGDGSTRRF